MLKKSWTNNINDELQLHIWTLSKSLKRICVGVTLPEGLTEPTFAISAIRRR